MTPRPIILTISAGGTSRRTIWNGIKPLPIGHSRRQPIQWVLERTAEGVRLRKVKPRAEARAGDAAEREVRFADRELELGTRLQLEGASIELKSSVRVQAAHRPGQGSGRLRVYSRARGWTLDSADLGLSYTGRTEGLPVFRIVATGNQAWLSAMGPEPLLLRTAQACHELKQHQELALSTQELSELTIRSGAYDWSFNRPDEVTLSPTPQKRDFLDSTLRQGAVAASSLFTVLLLASILWPRPELLTEKPLTPLPEITIANPLRFKAAAMASGGEALKKAAMERKGGSPAPAFEGDRLQSAMKGLFRGGMTKLLAKSEFAPGSDGSDSRRKLFNSSTPALHSTAPVTGPGVGSGTRIAALGGSGQGGSRSGSGKGVGYGQGEHANVHGQGRSLVAMDTTGSAVEEGLTKEEVGAVIHRHLSEVRYCYEASIIREPDLEGKLVMSFTINGVGKVKTAAVRNSTLPDSKLDDCIVRRLAAWRFPRTKGGIDVAVTYPFIFKTLGG